MKRYLVILISIISLHFLVADSIVSELTNDKSYKINNADKVTLSKFDEKYILYMKGNVDFDYGKINFNCDHANLIEAKEQATLFEDVQVLRDSLKIISDYASYDNQKEVVRFSGSVRAYEYDSNKQLKREFWAESLIYSRKDEVIRAIENVKAIEYDQDIIATAGYIEYRRLEGHGFMKINPCIENSKDSLIIRSQKLDYYEDYKKIVASYDVSTKFKGDADIYSSFLIYYTEEGKAIYSGEPEIVTEFGHGEAETFNIYFEENEMKKIEFVNECHIKFAMKENESDRNWVKANRIDVMFVDKHADSVIAQDDVSYFIISEEESKKSRDYMENRSNSTYMKLILSPESEIVEIRQKEKIHGNYIFKNTKRK